MGYKKRTADLPMDLPGHSVTGKEDLVPHITVHNHMPASHDDDAGEPPPWFQEHKAATDAAIKQLRDDLNELGSGLKKFFATEASEPAHQEGESEAEDQIEHGDPHIFGEHTHDRRPSNDQLKSLAARGVSMAQLNRLHSQWKWPT
jgi:hypothetical protein